MSKIQVGVIGTGYWGKKIVDEFSKIENVKIEAIADVNEDNLKFCADRFKVERTLKDYHQLLSIPDIKAVAVATPNELHYPVCKAALEAGKHVLVEKPITLDSKQGWELVALAERNNLTLAVGHIFRFNNAIAEAKRLIKEKFLGKLFLIDFAWLNLEKPFMDRDVIVDLAPHMFDMMNDLTGSWPVEISAVAAPHRTKVYETAHIHAKFADGTLATATLSWVVPKKTRQVSLIGETRSMFIDAVGQEITVFESGYTYKLGFERNNTIRDELLHFIDSFGKPIAETRNSGVIGVRTVELIEAAKKSVESGKAVQISIN